MWSGRYKCISRGHDFPRNGFLSRRMNDWIQAFKLRCSVSEDFKSDFCSQKGKKKRERANLESQRRTKAKTSFNVTQKPRGKGFILTPPVNLQGFALTLGRSRSSAVSPETLSNFCSFNALGKKVFFVERPKRWQWSRSTPSELQGSRLTCGFKTKSANGEKKRKKKNSVACCKC